MTRHLAWWVNTAWMWHCRREAGAFRAATADVGASQDRLLQSIIHRNTDSHFGREHGFASMRSFDDFRARVPISSYDAVAPRIDRLASGEPRVLTTEPVLMFEPTGGSSGGAKLVPYTATLRRQFQRAVAAWMWDVLRHMPGVRAGTAYWSISPAARANQRTAGGTRIGFDSDREYLDGLQRRAASRVLVAPPAISRLRNIDNFRYVTLGCLLAADDLALVSIWSPTFLTALVDALPAWGERLCRDLHDGTLRVPAQGDEAAVASLAWPPSPARSRAIAAGLAAQAGRPLALTDVWPRLALISCWADAAAAMYVPDLASRFPGVAIQPKGLLATEGVVSIPVVGQAGAALAIRSHVFEFVEAGDGEAAASAERPTLLAGELQAGRRYRVLLTTGGGLYRYDLGDVVQVVGFLRQCPLLRFLGRHGAGSDQVGEKLDERHVRECLRATCEELDVRADFAIVVPQTAPRGYVAIVASGRAVDTRAMTAAAAERLEARLRQNPQYRDAVDLGQLRPVDVCWLRWPPGRAWQIYEEGCRRLGQKSGDIKPTALDARLGWPELFRGSSAEHSAAGSTTGDRAVLTGTAPP